MKNIKKINVTSSHIPNKEKFLKYVNKIFESGSFSNRGNLTIELENKLKKKFDLNNIFLTGNGTLPILYSLIYFKTNSVVITTPFSYIATSSSILWSNLKIKFVDIERDYFTISPDEVLKNINKNTSAILATTVFGNAWYFETLEKICRENNLLLIYDSAHSFGSFYKQKSFFNYGDISTTSFHATKLFHTSEGGAMIINNDNYDKYFYMHNFGHKGPYNYERIGINGKIDEIRSAIGLSIIDDLDQIIERRKNVFDFYYDELNSNLEFIKIQKYVDWNYSYCPVLFNSEKSLLKTLYFLEKKNIFPRRYFYPSLNKIDIIKSKVECPISEDISKRILCLPFSDSLSITDLKYIIKTIKESLN